MATKKYVPEMICDRIEEYRAHGIQAIFDRGAEIQEQVLTEILELGNHSQYAKDHGFYGMTSKEAYPNRVPISEYKDYAPYIKENMQRDDGQVSILETEHYLLSTGQHQQGKYYIETRLGSLARQLSITLWNLNLMALEPVMCAPDVKMLAVTNCAPLESAPNGKAVRRTSGQAAKELWQKTPNLYVFPFEFLEAEMSEDDRDYLTALYVLKEKHFNMLFCNNLGYFGVVLNRIEREATLLIDDIRHGTMSVSLQAHDRRVLGKNFQPDPQRADELQTILRIKGHLSVEDIWPEFVFTGAWLAGSVGEFSKDVMAKLPSAMHYLSESYGASEAMLTIPISFNAKYGPLAVYSCYFEFRSLTDGKIYAMKDVKDGAYYELIISTYSGLYRYNLHDIVRVCGFTGSTANIEFCCRSSESVMLVDRKMYGFELAAFLHIIEEKTGYAIDFYQMRAEQGALTLFLQFREEAPDFINLCKILCAEAKRQQIPLEKIYWMKRNYRDQLYHSLMNHGRTVQCIKLPVVTNQTPDAQFIEAIYDAK